MEKQDLQSGESQWPNSNSTTRWIQEQKTQRYESRKMVLSQAQDWLDWKNSKNILG